MARVETTLAGPRVRARPDTDRLKRLAWRAARTVSPLLLLVGWELLARSGRVSDFMLPLPRVVAMQIAADVASGDFFLNLGLTLYRTFLGFGIAAVAGVVLGVAMARNSAARWFLDPLVSVGFPMPKIAFLPVFILWFGLYDAAKITIIAISAVFPVITATAIGLQGVEREIVWSAQSLGASPRRIAWEIVTPAAAPQILTGLQVALPTALIVAIVAEMMMGGYGLGAAMMEASRQLDSSAVFAGIVEVAVVGHGVISAMAVLRRYLLAWHPEALEQAAV